MRIFRWLLSRLSCLLYGHKFVFCAGDAEGRFWLECGLCGKRLYEGSRAWKRWKDKQEQDEEKSDEQTD